MSRNICGVCHGPLPHDPDYPCPSARWTATAQAPREFRTLNEVKREYLPSEAPGEERDPTRIVGWCAVCGDLRGGDPVCGHTVHWFDAPEVQAEPPRDGIDWHAPIDATARRREHEDREALRTLAEFARTAAHWSPDLVGRLPQRVQDALAVADAPPSEPAQAETLRRAIEARVVTMNGVARCLECDTATVGGSATHKPGCWVGLALAAGTPPAAISAEAFPHEC